MFGGGCINLFEYKTAGSAASAVFTEKKSKFIGHISPAKTQEEAVDFINKIRAEHSAATHNVYAYALRQNNLSRYSDDAEPAKTAGLPVLQVMQQNGVTDCVIVVTRYFGGARLGTGGLVRAYSVAASLALSAGGIVTMAMCTRFRTSVDYSFYDSLSALLAEFGCEAAQTEFAAQVSLTFSVKSELQGAFLHSFSEKSAGRFHCEEVGRSFAPVSLSSTSSG